MQKKTDIIIIGAGAAGLTAAIYGLRAGKSVTVFESALPGGKITSTSVVENYPGIVSVSGEQFGSTLVKQAESLGGIIVNSEIEEINANEKSVRSSCGDIYCAKAIIIAAGMVSRKPDAKNTQRFEGAGISYCAVCDGPLFKGKKAAVIGGGNSALSEAIYLSDICEKVYIIHRRNTFRAETHLVKAAEASKNIIFIFNSCVTAFNGDSTLKSIELSSKGQKEILEVNAAFPAIGYIPKCSLYKSLVKTDASGFALTDENCRTDAEGIFVAGDCRAKAVRQLTTAVSDGTTAAFNAVKYIESLKRI